MSESESNRPVIASGATVLQMPARTVRSAARRIPGTGVARDVVDGVLDTVGSVSPRARRIGAYAGAGLLAAIGVVDWPVAAAGAAAVWLTQSRAHDRDDEARPVGDSEAAPLHGGARQADLARSRKARHKNSKHKQRDRRTAS